MRSVQRLARGTLVVGIAALATGAYGQVASIPGGHGDRVGGDGLYAKAAGEPPLQDARDDVRKATSVVNLMKRDPDVARLLERAHGVFIVPDFVKIAAILGGKGGSGVAVMHDLAAGTWSAPAFYRVGAISVGPQIGAEEGSVAMILMSRKAAEAFTTRENDFSVNADVGLTIVKWSAEAEGTAGTGDVVVWSDTRGLLAAAAIDVSDISGDREKDAACYGSGVDVRQILSGRVSTALAAALRKALSS